MFDLRRETNMRFFEIAPEERTLLLKALDIDRDNLRCQHCGEYVDYRKCGIMPPIETKEQATILCTCVLCLSWYLTTIEEEK
jgi:hypothetical protein